MRSFGFILLLTAFYSHVSAQSPRELGFRFGVLSIGENNAITDVVGVTVGHTTLVEGESIRTGVTAILPHQSNIFQDKVPAAVYIGNGFGKLIGSTQVQELGNLETPIILTNTLSVTTAAKATVKYTLNQQGNENVRSVNAVVGETNDGYLNDIRGMHVKEEDVFNAIKNATAGKVAEGNVGAGTGTVCFGYKGGIGTSSRVLPSEAGGFTVGVLVQSNFGGVLTIDGTHVGEALGKYYLKNMIESADGSCMIVVATDAPLTSRNLERLAKRAIMGLARTGGIASNGSGDYVIAFSTNQSVRVPYDNNGPLISNEELHNNAMSPLFLATIEATEEAIINSLFAAESMVGRDGHKIDALPIGEVKKIFQNKK